MHRSHKIRLYPTPAQAELFSKTCGVARFAYNWGLERWLALRKEGKVVDAYQLRRELNAIKREEFPWMMEVTKCAPMEALLRLGDAFRNFSREIHEFPKFKKKGHKDSFQVSMDTRNFTLIGCCLKIPKIPNISTAEPLRFPTAKLLALTIKRVADRWYAVVRCELPDLPPSSAPCENQAESVVGVDLGLSTFVTLSTGEKVEHPRYLRRSEAKVARLRRQMRRKAPDSKNKWKAKMKFARACATVTNQRKFFPQKLSTDICRRFDHIKIEDLNVEGMRKNVHLSGGINDSGFYSFRKILSYKAKKLTVVDRWFASSKLCSACGTKYSDLTLSERTWACTSCGTIHDRDINAAINIERYATSPGGILPPAACGDLDGQSMKQETCTK